MYTLEQLKDQQKKRVLILLKSKYDFIYNHLVEEVKADLVNMIEGDLADTLSNAANDAMHTESFEGHNSSSSTELTFEEIQEAQNAYQENLKTLEELYNQE